MGSLEFIYKILSVVYSTATMSITYQPKKKKRKTTHGFLSRSKTKGGRKVIAARRSKGRVKLAV
jgi:large subunit ribosomal protein L34